MLNRFHLILERYGRSDRFAISISRVSMLTRDKNGTRQTVTVEDEYELVCCLSNGTMSNDLE